MKKFRWHLSTIAAMVGVIGPAYAQDEANGAQDSGPASASEMLADIVVTARRTEERLQDVPISITVLNQEQLAQRNIVTPVDLATYTPSLTINQRFGPEKSSFVIRGFTQEAGTSPSVGVYFADVVAPRAQQGTTSGNGIQAGAFFDLQNVQVLKGPQGTLFGRNTTGGAVLLVPRKPTYELEGYVEGSVGSYDLMRGQAVFNIPLSDSLRIRAGVDRQKRDGYLRNHAGIGPDNYNDVDYFAARFSMVADITPNLENYTVATYNNSFGTGYGARMLACNRNAATATATTARVLAPLACAQLDRQAARGDDLRDIELNNPDPFVKVRQWQAINTTTWSATDNLTVKNIVSYGEFRERDSFNLNGDNFTVPASTVLGAVPAQFVGQPFPYIIVGPAGDEDNASQSTFTEEFQLQGRAFDGRFDWQAGAYLEVSRPLGFSATNTAIALICTDPVTNRCVSPLGIGSLSKSATKTYFNNKGFYAQGTFDLTDQLSVTGGIRYTIDRVRSVSESTRARFLPPAQGGGLQDVVCNDSLRFFTLGANGVRGPLPVTDRSQCRNEAKSKSERPTWLIGADYKPTEDILLYAKWARGYRQGGVNMSNVGIETWGPEKVDSYEVGAKTSVRGEALQGYFNISGFYNNFTDQQITANLVGRNNSGFAGGTAIVNAGKSRIWGVEVDASATVLRNLRLDLGYTYLNTELKSLTLPSIENTPFISITASAELGGPLSFSPKNRLTASATYTLPLDESVGEVSIGATFTHTDSQRATAPAVSPLYLLPATDLLNLNFDWKDVLGSPFDLSAFVTNVTNEIYPVGLTSSMNTAGWETVLIGQPRMYGLRVRFKFGG